MIQNHSWFGKKLIGQKIEPIRYFSGFNSCCRAALTSNIIKSEVVVHKDKDSRDYRKKPKISSLQGIVNPGELPQ